MVDKARTAISREAVAIHITRAIACQGESFMFRVRSLIFLPVALALAACTPKSGDMLANTMGTETFEHTNTYCFGRFLVEVPREAKLETRYNEFYAKHIETGRGEEEFHEKVKETLEDRKKGNGIDKLLRIEYPEGGDSQIIINKVDLLGDIGYDMDVFALREQGYYFYFISAGPYSAEWIEKNAAVYRDIVLPALRYRPDYEIPREPGFCFENGFIAGESKIGWNERASLGFTLKDYPDVWIIVKSVTYFVPEKGLIERSNKGHTASLIEKYAKVDSMQPREINGIQGEELLLTVKQDGIVNYLYEFESRGEVENPLKPGITLQIETGRLLGGETVSTALTKAQVRELYEKVLTSIRPRPTGDAAGPPPPDILFIETGE